MCELEKMEKNRQFCKHGINHCMDVARIAYIMSLEKNHGIKKDIIYACAFLHDIGRVEEYENGTPHEISGANLAVVILKEVGYNKTEIEQIICAIRNHRSNTISKSDLENLISDADRKSRLCMFCGVRRCCKWSEEKKNKEIET